MTEHKQVKLSIPPDADMKIITGEYDSNMKALQEAFDSSITFRGDVLKISGEPAEVDTISLILTDLIKMAKEGVTPDPDYMKHAIEMRHQSEFAPSSLRDDILLTYRGHAIHPKTPGQKHYVNAIRENTITFGIGPAGTGKTYIAMAMALSALKNKQVGRIVLSRPILEAGENLGFLPGTLTEKVDPYIRPLYDALYDMVDAERAYSMLESGTIEIAPLAFMRGRTLNDSFVILDEAQNTSPEQMKMFLTRLGYGSKMIVTGDLSQSDLPYKVSGLLQAKDVLDGIEGIAFCNFKGSDVVRNSLVSKIIDAYEKKDL